MLPVPKVIKAGQFWLVRGKEDTFDHVKVVDYHQAHAGYSAQVKLVDGWVEESTFRAKYVWSEAFQARMDTQHAQQEYCWDYTPELKADYEAMMSTLEDPPEGLTHTEKYLSKMSLPEECSYIETEIMAGLGVPSHLFGDSSLGRLFRSN